MIGYEYVSCFTYSLPHLENMYSRRHYDYRNGNWKWIYTYIHIVLEVLEERLNKIYTNVYLMHLCEMTGAK